MAGQSAGSSPDTHTEGLLFMGGIAGRKVYRVMKYGKRHLRAGRATRSTGYI